MLTTLGAPRRPSRLRGRRGRSVTEGEPVAVPTNRATIVRTKPFENEAVAQEWLERLRGDRAELDAELADGVAVLARTLHAHRLAHSDPHPRDVSPRQALVVRVGFGDGESVVDGQYASAWELPAQGARTRRSVEAPEERFAALLGARERALACEELVLRARADLDAGRMREAALQARVALEAVLAELEGEIPAQRRAVIEQGRKPIGRAANAALQGELDADLVDSLAEVVRHMESVLRSRRLSSSF